MPEVVALGVVLGLVYGLSAVGLVLAYRVSEVLNLAHADIGVAVATVFAVAVTRWNAPYWAALPLALLLGVVVGAIAHVAVVRRLRDVPRLISVVATLGLGQVLVLTASAVAGTAAVARFPEPPGLPTFDLGALHVGQATSAMLAIGPVAVIAVWAWLTRTTSGLRLRASAANRSAARLIGVPADRSSALAWGVAGALSVLTAVFVGAAPGFVGGSFSGPGLLLRALAAAVIAGMHSLPVALIAGVGIGVVDQVTGWNTASGGIADALLFVAVAAALIVRRARPASSAVDAPSWVNVDVWRPLPLRVRSVPRVRRAFRLAAVAGALAAVALPVVVSNSTAVVLTAIVAFATVGLSVAIVTGLGGRLTLGHFAIAGAGAVASVHIATRTGNFLLGFAAAGAVGVVAASVAGIPALRARGPFLAVTTLAFAVAAETWLLPRPWALGTGVDPGKPIIGAVALDTGRGYYLVALAVGGSALWVARNLHRSGIARRLVAVRDNEPAAQALGIDATRTGSLAFGLSGAIAGLGGAAYVHSLALATPGAFPVPASIVVVAIVVVGGIGVLLGPLIGALYIIGVPAFLPLDAAWLAATALGWLVLILYVPAGLARPLRLLRDRLACVLAGHPATDLDAPTLQEEAPRALPTGLPGSVAAPTRPPDTLEASGLRRTFGDLTAVDAVDLEVRPGEIVGIVGPNGAGKTTVIDLLAGAQPTDGGRVLLGGEDVTALEADRRARLGIVRSFQETRLFPTLTVLDTVRVAQELETPTRLLPAAVGRRRDERHRTAHAREITAAFGLDAYVDVPVRALSTGVRRICELACLASLQPRVMLLDEPSAGLAQAEVDRLGPLLLQLRTRFGASLVIVEHDVRLITSIADRLVAMDRGRIVTQGRPAKVARHPEVLAAYLGGVTGTSP
ncbi:MAG: ATP-binding cassette domain-containing protein [Actinobacteria bacterium]|nr:ATP-binding cassette domain-containing protein [Actinomycetota bacterium]